MPFSDLWLVHRARSGDRRAFGSLYDRHGARVFNLLRRLCADATAAEDLTQETFLRAHSALGTWRGRGSFSSWLAGIAVRCYRNTHRQARAEDALDEGVAAGIGGDPLSALAASEMRRLLDNAILQLPDTSRVAFVLVYVERLSYKEAAALLEIPIGTVQSRLASAKERLQVILAGTIAAPASSEAPITKEANSHAS